jgi:hypothetical protein
MRRQVRVVTWNVCGSHGLDGRVIAVVADAVVHPRPGAAPGALDVMSRLSDHLPLVVEVELPEHS